MEHRERPQIDCPSCGRSYREKALHCPECGEANPLFDAPPRGGPGDRPELPWRIAALAAVAAGGFLIAWGLAVEPLALSGQIETTYLGLGCALVLGTLIVRQVRRWLQ
jgi:hypothetical protein